ncbi:uncharacterized protein EI90DRAFT_3114452 [Cantharellus anzutake]|uniref:uncharacterized protein n=1 Tax=Cantharellus anzutake TaxID=1750568 RepID=UPI0019048E9A|nr:uncharacterized protein EI90DRAFT_3114452 [Cantharellus anzutake]KAF8343853.1 hypothetical protein EI90DRAFT_3114452 [Cantharellus anzutake]
MGFHSVTIISPTAYKQRAPPAYKFASELQERLNSEEVFEKLLSQEISLPLGSILGSSFELNKRLQMAMKVQRILIAKKAETVVLDLEPSKPLPVEEEELYFRPIFDVSSLESEYSDDSDSRESVNTDEHTNCWKQSTCKNAASPAMRFILWPSGLHI